MNLIVIVLDSFRQDHVSLYHGGEPVFPDVPACQTPNIDAFARHSLVFDNAIPEALPTIPIRMQLMTGQRTLPYRPWQPLAPHDVTIAEILGRAGYTCGLISDTYHYRAPGMNYHRGFHAYEWIRGQEYDPYVSSPPRRPVEGYVNANYPDPWRKRIAQFLANTDDLQAEEHRFPAQVVDRAVDWLEKNRCHEKAFLWIDSFDPHEPWDPPARWDTYTEPGTPGPRLIMPMGGPASQWASEAEIRQIRGLYGGEAAFVDHCLGRLFQALERLGYLEDSLVLLMADHGHPLGDHGKFLKGADRLHNELLKVPFILRLPSGVHRRCGALVQFHDVLPTLLELLGMGNEVQVGEAMHGRSFRPVIAGDADDHRTAVITGYHAGIDRCIRDRGWSFVERPAGQPDELYDLEADPREQRNLIDERPEEAVRLASQFGRLYRREGPRGCPRRVRGLQGEYELASGAVE